MDESTADDGALFAFWAFVEARRELGRAPFDLTDLADFRTAVAAFELGDLS